MVVSWRRGLGHRRAVRIPARARDARGTRSLDASSMWCQDRTLTSSPCKNCWHLLHRPCNKIKEQKMPDCCKSKSPRVCPPFHPILSDTQVFPRALSLYSLLMSSCLHPAHLRALQKKMERLCSDVKHEKSSENPFESNEGASQIH